MISLSKEYIESILDYNPETGIFKWKISKKGIIKGKIGTRQKCGRLLICINGKHYLAHRLAWLLMTGNLPDFRIDHKDTNQANNTWNNLRPASHQENLWNRGPQKNNSLGLKGVSRIPTGFKARIAANGKQRYLGVFKTAEEASKAYQAAAISIHGKFARW